MTLGDGIALAALAFLVGGSVVGYFVHRLDRRVDILEKKVESSSPAVLASKVERLEKDYTLLHTWKNLWLERDLDNRFANTHGLIERIERGIMQQLDRLNRRVFNGEKE